jgi:hypothetical protein
LPIFSVICCISERREINLSSSPYLGIRFKLSYEIYSVRWVLKCVCPGPLVGEPGTVGYLEFERMRGENKPFELGLERAHKISLPRSVNGPMSNVHNRFELYIDLAVDDVIAAWATLLRFRLEIRELFTSIEFPRSKDIFLGDE